MFVLKPATDPKRSSDGYRILIEPHWPADLPKGKSAGVDWMKELYPSQNLRDFMKRNPRKGDQFRDSYLLELAQKETAVEKVCRMHKERGTVTILTVPVNGPWEIHETLVKYLQASCE